MITRAERPPDGRRPLFEQFIGIWRTDIHYVQADGSAPRHVVGDWEFGSALDGRAVTDVWRVPSHAIQAEDADREVGLCVRIWDPRLQLWRFTFHSTASTTVIHMYAQPIGDDIFLERAEPDRLERWVFHAIQDDTFAWRKEVSRGGGPWKILQTVEARRMRSRADSAQHG